MWYAGVYVGAFAAVGGSVCVKHFVGRFRVCTILRVPRGDSHGKCHRSGVLAYAIAWSCDAGLLFFLLGVVWVSHGHIRVELHG